MIKIYCGNQTIDVNTFDGQDDGSNDGPSEFINSNLIGSTVFSISSYKYRI